MKVTFTGCYMNQNTQLLCTFCIRDDINIVVDEIKHVYKLAFNSIYVLNNIAEENQVILTYNIDPAYAPNGQAPQSTISVHRKKQTNTIYTINAINKLIEERNNGVLDKSFKIDWSELQNMVLVTAYGKLKNVNTKLSHIITL